jgi:hypothetical protein
LGGALGSLRWYRWDTGEAVEGWSLLLAVEDRHNGWSAAIGAADLLEEEEDL